MILSLLCIKSLRRVSSLIDWNWDSNVELRLIAKISALNELSSTESATKQIFDWLINSQNAKTVFLLICYSNSFWIVSLLFHQRMIFLLYRDLDVSSNDYSLRASRWCLRLYDRRELFYAAKDVFSKNSRSKNQKLELDVLNYWWFLMFDDSVLRLVYCYCFCSWSDQKYVDKCFFWCFVDLKISI